jgi:DNA modification methylase
MTVRIMVGDCRQQLKKLAPKSVQMVVTSPPYFGLRDYGVDGQLGLEASPAEYVKNLVRIFRAVRRVLRDDGTIWVNLGDSYYSPRYNGGVGENSTINSPSHQAEFRKAQRAGKNSMVERGALENAPNRIKRDIPGIKPKDLFGIPWRVAFALQADGWYLRQDIVWSKRNPKPESVRDRCTRAHEYVFLLSKSERYYFNPDAIAEPAIYAPGKTRAVERPKGYYKGKHAETDRGRGTEGSFKAIRKTRNKRSVWHLTSRPFKGAHFATFPPALPELCIKAGCPDGGTVLDIFAGSGTTGLVAERLQRDAILIELNPDYAAMAERRIKGDSPILASVECTA